MEEIVIRKDVPVPVRQVAWSDYLKKLEVGHSFLIPVDVDLTKAIGSIRVAAHRLGIKVSVRKDEEGRTGVWRVKDDSKE
ncbi:hypothetical protein [Burkholderia vietnamiensis]|uniref:hypothetical protein n=1 Tax=Burkholderia vietnamiensis TaxID=60552 RepID=UPI001CB51D44|nr:hypothetical protein [Burkholderia vietnamiensis]CAG9229117.1 hypothetical protein BVI1335_70155 [Burkholderia vietnamiensis]HDR9086316.1 hypothetical protein [Burkholderia vietnamiensis]